MKEKRDWYDYTIGICLIIVLAVIPLFVSAVRTDITISESSIRGGSSVTDVSALFCRLFFGGCVFNVCS